MGLIDNHSIESVTKGRKSNLKYPSYFYHTHEFSYVTQRKGLYNNDEKICRKPHDMVEIGRIDTKRTHKKHKTTLGIFTKIDYNGKRIRE